MANGVGVPPDIAAQMSQQGQRGIGGGASQNAKTLQQRTAAMNPTLAAEQKAEAEKAVEAEQAEAIETMECTSASCKMEVDPEWNYCPRCKTSLLKGGPGKELGISFSEKDLTDYLFKGFIIKDIKLLGRHVVTLKSGQPIDLEAIDDYIMNGDWAKNSDGTDRKISDYYMRQMNAMCMTASAVSKIDGESIGNTLIERMEWIREKGSSFVDILSTRVSLFTAALAEFLEKEDTFLGS